MVVRARSPIVAEVRLFPEGSARPHPGRWSEQAGDVPAGGVPGRALRALRLRDPIELFPRIVANWERRHGAGSAMKVLGRFGTSKTKAIVPRRPGRAGRSDDFYAVWAVAYLERVRAGSRHPAKDLAARPPFRLKGDLPDAGGASVNTVRDILQEARRRGLLSSPPRGTSGGELTEKAERILSKLSRRRRARP